MLSATAAPVFGSAGGTCGAAGSLISGRSVVGGATGGLALLSVFVSVGVGVGVGVAGVPGPQASRVSAARDDWWARQRGGVSTARFTSPGER